MTIVRKEYIKHIAGRNRIYQKIILYLQCDHCHKQYVCPENIKNRSLKQNKHFCDKKCTGDSIKCGSLREKIETSILNKYGVKGYVSTNEFKNKSKESCLKKYGVDHGMKSELGKNNFKKACLEKYGTPAFAGSEIWRLKIDPKEIAQKAWKTKIKNGTCSTSIPEEKLYVVLCDEFGFENVQRQVSIMRQWIDFYIISINLYVQLDGIYWHGLDRDINEIKKSPTRLDKHIYKTHLRDRKLDEYMKNNNMKMIRITDIFFNKSNKEEIIKILRNT